LGKLKKTKTKEFKTLSESEYWEETIKFIEHGVPSKDDKGHSCVLSVRVMDAQRDMVGQIKELYKFSSPSDTLRRIIAVGCYHLLYRAKTEYYPELMDHIETLIEIMDVQNYCARLENLENLRAVFLRQRKKAEDRRQSGMVRKIQSALDKIDNWEVETSPVEAKRLEMEILNDKNLQ